MEKDKKSEVNITNNFNAPIGQHIDHVDTINLRMDGDGTFHFGMVENLKANEADASAENNGNAAGMAATDDSDSCPFEPAEDLCRFIHPTLSGDAEMKVHDEIKKIVKRQGVQEICLYLQKMADDKKILLPQNPGVAYKELVRMGMPDGEGFGEKYFSKCYAASKR